MQKQILINGEITKYLIDSRGFVISTAYRGHPGIKRTLVHSHDVDGYCIITLNHKGKKYTRKIHRLVAEYFIPNPNNLPQVNHKNGNKNDNDVRNLEWMSGLDNIRHAMDTNLRYRINFEEYIHDVCRLISENKLSIPEISDETGISQSTIRKILKKKQWVDISDNYDMSKYSVTGYADAHKHASHKMTEDQVIEVAKLLELNYPCVKIAKIMSITPRMVYGIKYRKSYTDITKDYNF